MHESPGLKSDCLEEIKSFSTSKKLLQVKHSNILTKLGAGTQDGNFPKIFLSFF